jgi:hypothetical protein
LPAHYAIFKSEGQGAVQAWIDLLPDRQTDCARRVGTITTCQAFKMARGPPVSFNGQEFAVRGLRKWLN